MSGPGTPLPWRSLRGAVWTGKPAQTPVASFVLTDDATFAVRACNSFPALVEALETVIRYRCGEGEFNFTGLTASERENEQFDAWQGVEAKARAAISLALSGDALAKGEG